MNQNNILKLWKDIEESIENVQYEKNDGVLNKNKSAPMAVYNKTK